MISSQQRLLQQLHASITTHIRSAYEQVVKQFDDHPLFVMFSPQLNCNVKTDHLYPKNVYPIFEPEIQRIFKQIELEITLDATNSINEYDPYSNLKADPDSAMNQELDMQQMKNLVEKCRVQQEEEQKAYSLEKQKLNEQIQDLREQLYANFHCGQCYQPDYEKDCGGAVENRQKTLTKHTATNWQEMSKVKEQISQMQQSRHYIPIVPAYEEATETDAECGPDGSVCANTHASLSDSASSEDLTGAQQIAKMSEICLMYQEKDRSLAEELRKLRDENNELSGRAEEQKRILEILRDHIRETDWDQLTNLQSQIIKREYYLHMVNMRTAGGDTEDGEPERLRERDHPRERDEEREQAICAPEAPQKQLQEELQQQTLLNKTAELRIDTLSRELLASKQNAAVLDGENKELKKKLESQAQAPQPKAETAKASADKGGVRAKTASQTAAARETARGAVLTEMLRSDVLLKNMKKTASGQYASRGITLSNADYLALCEFVRVNGSQVQVVPCRSQAQEAPKEAVPAQIVLEQAAGRDPTTPSNESPPACDDTLQCERKPLELGVSCPAAPHLCLETLKQQEGPWPSPPSMRSDTVDLPIDQLEKYHAVEIAERHKKHGEGFQNGEEEQHSCGDQSTEKDVPADDPQEHCDADAVLEGGKSSGFIGEPAIEQNVPKEPHILSVEEPESKKLRCSTSLSAELSESKRLSATQPRDHQPLDGLNQIDETDEIQRLREEKLAQEEFIDTASEILRSLGFKEQYYSSVRDFIEKHGLEIDDLHNIREYIKFMKTNKQFEKENQLAEQEVQALNCVYSVLKRETNFRNVGCQIGGPQAEHEQGSKIQIEIPYESQIENIINLSLESNEFIKQKLLQQEGATIFEKLLSQASNYRKSEIKRIQDLADKSNYLHASALEERLQSQFLFNKPVYTKIDLAEQTPTLQASGLNLHDIDLKIRSIEDEISTRKNAVSKALNTSPSRPVINSMTEFDTEYEDLAFKDQNIFLDQYELLSEEQEHDRLEIFKIVYYEPFKPLFKLPPSKISESNTISGKPSYMPSLIESVTGSRVTTIEIGGELPKLNNFKNSSQNAEEEKGYFAIK